MGPGRPKREATTREGFPLTERPERGTQDPAQTKTKKINLEKED